jgi:integrase
MSDELLDCLGRRRSPAATSAFHTGRPSGNRGLRYPADPPSVEEIIAVMRTGTGAYGDRLRAMIVVLWRAGLRIGEALALAETDLDASRGAITIRRGKGGKRREVGRDQFAWEHLDTWLERRRTLPVGALFCILHGPPAGDPGLRLRSAVSSAARA